MIGRAGIAAVGGILTTISILGLIMWIFHAAGIDAREIWAFQIVIAGVCAGIGYCVYLMILAIRTN